MENLVLVRPIITEKSMSETARGWYTFEVAKKSTKGGIARIVEQEFGVHVTSVKTAVVKGSQKRSGKRGLLIRTPDYKKASVRLKKGETIALFATEKK